MTCPVWPRCPFGRGARARAGAVPGVTIRDGSARVQTGSREGNPRSGEPSQVFCELERVADAAEHSFNVRGES